MTIKLLHELGGWGMIKFTLLWEILEFLFLALLLLFVCFSVDVITPTPFPDRVGKWPKIGVLGTFLCGLSRPSSGGGLYSTTAVHGLSRRWYCSIWQSLDLAVSTHVRNRWTCVWLSTIGLWNSNKYTRVRDISLSYNPTCLGNMTEAIVGPLFQS